MGRHHAAALLLKSRRSVRWRLSLSLTVTLAGLCAFGVLFAAANLLSRRPPEPGKVRLIPYDGIQFIALVGVVLLLAHLVGLVTGQPLAGRLGP